MQLALPAVRRAPSARPLELGRSARRGTLELPAVRMDGGFDERRGDPYAPRAQPGEGTPFAEGYAYGYGAYAEPGMRAGDGGAARNASGADVGAPTPGADVGAPFSSGWWRDVLQDPEDRDVVGLGYDWREWAEPALVRKRVRLQQTVATIRRVIVPSIICTVLGVLYFDNITALVMRSLDKGGLAMVMTDESQFIQNFLTVIGLLFSILAGNAYSSLYTQQETIYFALFQEVSEAKSLLEQTTLVCQGRPFYPAVLAQFELYVSQDLRRLDLPPAYLLSSRPAEDPLEAIMFMTSVGVPSVIYETVKSLRQARGHRLGACQRKFPSLGIALLYVLALLELVAFPLLGAGTAQLSMRVLNLQSSLFGLLCGALVMVLRVIQELRLSSGGVFTVDLVLRQMVSGLEAELEQRRRAAAFPPLFGAEPGRRGPPPPPPLGGSAPGARRPASGRAYAPVSPAVPPPSPTGRPSGGAVGAGVSWSNGVGAPAAGGWADQSGTAVRAPPAGQRELLPGASAEAAAATDEPIRSAALAQFTLPPDGAQHERVGPPSVEAPPPAPQSSASTIDGAPLSFWRRAFDDGGVRAAQPSKDPSAMESQERASRRRQVMSTLASAAAAALALFDL